MALRDQAAPLLAMLAGFLVVNACVQGVAVGLDLGEHPADLQTPNMARARLNAWFDRPATGPRVVFAGDSLLAGRNLEDELGEQWPSATLPAAVQRLSGGRLDVLNFGIEGVLWGDVHCMVQQLLDRGVQGLVLHLNPRPFSDDFADPDSQLSRPWLCAQVNATPARRAWSRLADRVPVLAWRDLLQDRLFGGPLRARAVGLVLGSLPVATDAWEDDPEDAAALQDALWRIQAAQRYNAVTVDAAHPSMQALRSLLGLLRDSGVPTLLIYSAEDTEAIAQQLDRAHYDSERAAFIQVVTKTIEGAPNLRFLAVPREALAGEYDDHVHLTAAGYARLAEPVLAELNELLPPGEGPRAD